MVCGYFSQSVTGVFILLTLSSADQMFLILMKSSLSYFSFMDYAFGIMSKNSVKCWVTKILSCFLVNILVLCFTFMCDPFAVIVRGKVQLFACGRPVVPSAFVKKTVLSPLNCVSTLVKDQIALFMWICFWTLVWSLT